VTTLLNAKVSLLKYLELKWWLQIALLKYRHLKFCYKEQTEKIGKQFANAEMWLMFVAKNYRFVIKYVIFNPSDNLILAICDF